MGYIVKKQPDGLFAVWSTIVDGFVAIDATLEDLVDWYADRERKRVRRELVEFDPPKLIRDDELGALELARAMCRGQVLEPRYFSWSPSSMEFELHDTLEAARETAQAALESDQDAAADSGWPELTEDIAYGEIRGRVVESARKPWADHLRDLGREVEPGETFEFEEFVDYRLEEIE